MCARSRQALRVTRHLAEHPHVVEFRLVAENVRVGVRGDSEVALTDKLPDPRPRLTAQMLERDTTVPQAATQPQRTSESANEEDALRKILTSLA